MPGVAAGGGAAVGPTAAARPPLRGLLVLGAPSVDGLRKAVDGDARRA